MSESCSVDNYPLQYRTTRPGIPRTADRTVTQARVSDNLTIELRPISQADLEDAHRLRTQEAVMVNTSTGVVDGSLEVTQSWLDRFLAPNDAVTFNFMLWAKQDSQPWDHVGVIGSHIIEPVAHIGYMLRTEWWGKGIATKAVEAFLRLWWSLPRKEVMLEIPAKDKHGRHIAGLEYGQDDLRGHSTDGVKTVSEIMLAEVEQSNIGSICVVERNGFVQRDQEIVVEDAGTFIIKDYVLAREETTCKS